MLHQWYIISSKGDYISAIDHITVTKEPSHIHSEESFTPTIDINEGWILVYQYSTYDSFGPNEGLETVVVDMYKTRGDADEQAELLIEHAKNNDYDRKNNPLKHANGKNVPYLCGFGWGSNLEKCFIKKVKIQDLEYYEYEVRYV